MNQSNHYDVIILGTGPAGLQAAIHAARKKVSVLMLGKESKSSLFHAHVENFCCLFKVSGEEMLRVGREQASQFGTFILDEDVLTVSFKESIYAVTTESGSAFFCQSLIIATGATRNRLRVPGEKPLVGRGVSYCVECDANFFKGEDVAVVGGESAAAGGVLTLLHDAKSVHMVFDDLQVADALKEKLLQSDAILHSNSSVKEIIGQNQVDGILLNDGSKIDVTGVFIELGAKGVMELATTLGIQLDDDMKYIQTNKNMETNVPGVFAAGDICGPPWQMAKAVGEGCVAGIAAADYVKKTRTPA
jgi:thioredoxin reductase (NADPH)